MGVVLEITEYKKRMEAKATPAPVVVPYFEIMNQLGEGVRAYGQLYMQVWASLWLKPLGLRVEIAGK